MGTPVNSNMSVGFKAVRMLSGAPVLFNQFKFATAAGDSVAIFPGDAIKLTGGVDANGFLIVAQANAGDVPLIGVMSSVFPDGTNPQNSYRLPSTATYIFATVDPNTIYEVQASAAVALAAAGKCGSMVQTVAGNTLTGISGQQLDQSTLATNTATFAFKVMGFTQLIGNIPNATYNKVLVKINNHAWAPSGVAIDRKSVV